VAQIDALVGQLRDVCRPLGVKIVVLSEYGMSEVQGSIDLNRFFRRQGWIGVNSIKGKEYIELGDCAAFAMVDHQVAHIYIRSGMVREVRSAIQSEFPSVRLLDRKEQTDLRIAHERSGDLVAIAPRDRWFSYAWWLDDDRAPSFARTVDIHRKPGYDPLELFIDPEKKGISFDTNRIKGSHGRPPESEHEMGVFISPRPLDIPRGARVRAPEVAGYLSRLVASPT
jgi:predicted AlkP superfamily pyrophosphatase or phosphodiesterase